VPDKKYGVARRGKKWVAAPWIPGQNKHAWTGTFDTQEEATKAAIAKIEELRRLPANLETVETFAKRWTRDFPRPKESTNDRYRKDAERFANYVGPAKKLHEVTVPEARSYAQAHRHDLGALRAMFSDARRDGLVLENPFSELGISKGRGRRDIVPVTAEELGEIAEIARRVHDEFGPTFRAIIVFTAYTGLRPGEVFGLDRHDVDFEAETVHVRQNFHKRRLTLPKSGKTRKVFLTPPAAQALREMPRRLDGEHLFAGKESQRITQSALTGYWRPVRAAFEATLDPRRRQEFEQAGKGSLDFYAITRHFCATFLVEQGVESWVVAKQLGHEDGGRLVEKTYGHPNDRIAREKLRRVFDKPTPLRAVEAQEATG
jgi:integrase